MLGPLLAAAAFIFASACNAAAEKAKEPSARAGNSLQAPTSTDVLRGELARQVHELLRAAASQGFGGAVIVEVDDEVVLQGGYGFADRERRIPFRANTVHAIGSITKPFTALAILDLVQRGRLDLHTPVGRYLPGSAEPGASLTLHQLMTHTSGMAEYCGDDEQRVTRADLLTRCMALPLRHPPGGKWAYSNPAYSVLAAVVEQVSGASFDDYLKSRFFLPLGLDRTGNTLPHLGYGDIAKHYVDNKLVRPTPGREVDGQHWQLAGNGGIQSSAIDMYHWYLAMKGVLPLDPELAAAMIQPRAERAKNLAASYGWVVIKDEAGDQTYVGHDGSDGSFYAAFAWRPKERVFFYLVGNNGEEEVVPVLRQVRKLVTLREPSPAGAPEP